MHPKLFSSMNDAMQKWISDRAEDDEYIASDTLTSPNIALNMARAAAAVWDSMVDSSVFTAEQVSE
jgi:hypothetical protein